VFLKHKASGVANQIQVKGYKISTGKNKGEEWAHRIRNMWLRDLCAGLSLFRLLCFPTECI
jgi:hypothetical protein